MEENKDVKYWLGEIDSAKRREKDFRSDGERINLIRNGTDNTPFNILFSNTETLSPALYSNTPQPAVRRKNEAKGQNADLLGKAAADASQRMLSYLIENNVEGYEKFDDAINSVVLDALLPGRGSASVKFDADIAGSEETDDESVEWASICADSHKWNRVYYGYATKWEKTPWIAYEDYIDESDAKRMFDAKIVSKIKFSAGEEEDDDEKGTGTGGRDDADAKGARKTALIYQIWDKSDRTVKYVSPAYKDGYLDEQDDPLGISGFFNCPKPLQFVRKSNDMMPTALYSLYEEQAKELNRLTKRINKVVEAIKVRGAYNAALGDDLEKIMSEDDTALVPTDKATGLMEGGFDKNIWMLPIQDLIIVARELMSARESVKQTIYEITGISDIIRGQSRASETLGAQEIKQAWGTMRLKNMQKDVQIYVRNMMRIMLDVAVEKFPEKLWVRMTSLDYLTEEQEMQVKQQIEALTMQMQKAQMMMQQQAAGQPPVQGVPMAGTPNQPPQKPQMPPQMQKLQQDLQKAQQMMQKPKWREVLGVLKDDYIRSYVIDIETNSTLDVEATEDKKNVGEFMNAMAQFMNGMLPMIEKKILPFGAAKSFLLAITQRYRFGREVEDEIRAMQEPKGQGGDPKQLQEAQKKLMQEKQKFEQERDKAGKDLDGKYKELEEKNLQFQFEQKLFAQEQQFAQKLSDVTRNAEEQEAKSELKEMIQNHKRDVQSMLDKHAAKIQVKEIKNSNLPV